MTLVAIRMFAGLLALLVALPLAVAQARAEYSRAELDRMLAPIALYPDPLLSQILMASTYPLEIVEAARWSRANPGLQGDDAVRAVQDKDWDPSVKSLVAFPDVLRRMDENPEWTRSLGDAFLEQEPHVMETIQALRRKAQAAGSLEPDERYRVVEDGRTIAIEPARPHVVYVPYYDPWVVYGPWWWPAYPPVAWAPWPGYMRAYRPGVSVRFWWGPPIGLSVGFFFGNVDWRHRHVRVTHANSYYYRPVMVKRDVHANSPARQVNVAPGKWQHDPWHRRGIAYRNPAIQQRFAAAAPAVSARAAVPAREVRNEARLQPNRPFESRERHQAEVRPQPRPAVVQPQPQPLRRAEVRPQQRQVEARIQQQRPEASGSRTERRETRSERPRRGNDKASGVVR